MIESRKNRYLKDIRRLRRSKGNRALLEGPHLITEALAGGIELEVVLATPEFLAAAPRALLASLERPPVEIAAGLLDELADADSPRGIIAVAHLPRDDHDLLPVAADGIYLFVAGLQDPGNLGAIARVAEAVSATAMALAPGSVHPNHPRSLRASAGSLLRLPVAVDVSPEALETRLRGLDPAWIALSPTAPTEVYDAAPSPPLVLAIGAEKGLPDAVAERCATSLRIPMAAPVDSLNTAVAVAVALFEIRRQATQTDDR